MVQVLKFVPLLAQWKRTQNETELGYKNVPTSMNLALGLEGQSVMKGLIEKVALQLTPA